MNLATAVSYVVKQVNRGGNFRNITRPAAPGATAVVQTLNCLSLSLQREEIAAGANEGQENPLAAHGRKFVFAGNADIRHNDHISDVNGSYRVVNVTKTPFLNGVIKTVAVCIRETA